MTSHPVGQEGHCFLVTFFFVGLHFHGRSTYQKSDIIRNHMATYFIKFCIIMECLERKQSLQVKFPIILDIVHCFMLCIWFVLSKYIPLLEILCVNSAFLCELIL